MPAIPTNLHIPVDMSRQKVHFPPLTHLEWSQLTTLHLIHPEKFLIYLQVIQQIHRQDLCRLLLGSLAIHFQVIHLQRVILEELREILFQIIRLLPEILPDELQVGILI